MPMSKRKKRSNKRTLSEDDLGVNTVFSSSNPEVMGSVKQKKKRSESMYSTKDKVLKSLSGKARKKHSFDNTLFAHNTMDAVKEAYKANVSLPSRSRSRLRNVSDSNPMGVKRSAREMMDDEITYDQHGAVVGFSIKGSIRVALKVPSKTENWIKKILLTHKNFDEFESTLLLSELVNVFMEEEEFLKMTKQASVVNILIYWMKWFPHHFNEELMGDLKLFNDWLCEQSIYGYYETLLNDSMKLVQVKFPEKPELKDNATRAIDDDIFDYSFTEISEQLTLMLHESYSKIDVSVYLLDAKIDEQSKFINTISHWVSMECMLYAENKVDDQIEILEFFSNMLRYLYDIKNYGGMFSIYTGLILHEVTRLEGYEDFDAKLSSYEKLCAPLNNFRALNYHQDRVDPPYILHLPAVSHTIIRNNDILQDTISPGIFNVCKMDKYNEIYEKMTILQSVSYDYEKNQEIQDFITSRLTFAQNEKVLQQLGLQTLIS